MSSYINVSVSSDISVDDLIESAPQGIKLEMLTVLMQEIEAGMLHDDLCDSMESMGDDELQSISNASIKLINSIQQHFEKGIH